jgi:CDP-paratose 2-epimerase
MKVLITGICGFAGSSIALGLMESTPALQVVGVDNFIRPGSELNRQRLRAAGIRVVHGDLREPSDVLGLPDADWVIDAAAHPSVLAGSPGHDVSSYGLARHNVDGTINVLEYCRARGAGLIVLSTSRVYSIATLRSLTLGPHEGAFRPVATGAWPEGVSSRGVSERCSCAPPLSLYGATKACSEILALEYGHAFGFPVWINRLGVLAGAGQFARADQGIVSYWIHACARGRRLEYVGFGGNGHQVRDCLHPRDLVSALLHQMRRQAPEPGHSTTNFSGGITRSLSLRQLTAWCEERFGKVAVGSQPHDRPYDIPWLVLDSAEAERRFGWQPTTSLGAILEEIAQHATAHPGWLEMTSGL